MYAVGTWSGAVCVDEVQRTMHLQQRQRRQRLAAVASLYFRKFSQLITAIRDS